MFSVSVDYYVYLHWIFIRALINAYLNAAFLVKDSDKHIMKQVFGETSKKIKKETFLTQSNIIMIAINLSPKNTQH